MVKFGHADGLVCGAIHSTADTLRPALQIVKTRPGAKCVSSCVLLEVPDSRYEKEYIFADCGLIQKPTVEELSEIAIASNDTYKQLIGETPKLAMLSYSTYGSAKAEEIDTVKAALELVKEKRKDIIIDGELQLDAALDKNVAKLKAPGSKVAGEANVLIFPNLEAGNIGYKLVERLGNGTAYGPITQGLAKPINDLSRGCKAKDIVGAIAITAVQANAK
jgi:phosphate acetyltransferase